MILMSQGILFVCAQATFTGALNDGVIRRAQVDDVSKNLFSLPYDTAPQ